jgi:hypothetical protein
LKSFFTGLSFIGLSKQLLREGFRFILTEKLLCQDSLEQYFSKQRAGTGSNNAPSMAQFLSFNRLHTVTREVETDIARGNCTRLSKGNMIINDTPLPKRKR